MSKNYQLIALGLVMGIGSISGQAQPETTKYSPDNNSLIEELIKQSKPIKPNCTYYNFTKDQVADALSTSGFNDLDSKILEDVTTNLCIGDQTVLSVLDQVSYMAAMAERYASRENAMIARHAALNKASKLFDALLIFREDNEKAKRDFEASASFVYKYSHPFDDGLDLSGSIETTLRAIQRGEIISRQAAKSPHINQAEQSIWLKRAELAKCMRENSQDNTYPAGRDACVKQVGGIDSLDAVAILASHKAMNALYRTY